MGEEKFTGATKYLNIFKSKKEILWDNFLGGIAWALGTFVGFAAIAVIAGIVISRIDLIPIIGGWLKEILQTATTSLPNGK